MVHAKVTAVTKEDVTVGLFTTIDGGEVLITEKKKAYSSLDALYGLVTRWYPGKKFPKIPHPTGIFAPSLQAIQKSLQEFFDIVIKEVGDEGFPIKAFFRLPDYRGKVVIITGASSGIGKQNAYQLAEMGAHVILATRSEQKTLPIVEAIKAKTGNPNVEFSPLDLQHLDSVRTFVENFKNRNLPLHLLINNAASVVEGITDYGVDLTYSVCHVAPFLLTVSLLDILKKTPNSRIVWVASEIAVKAPGLPWERIRSKIPLGITNPTEAYGYAKLANVLTAKLLAKKLAEEGSHVKTYALHPGVVGTAIWDVMGSVLANIIRKFTLNEEEGSQMTLYCAIADGAAEESGLYYDYYTGPRPQNPQFPKSEDVELQRVCWEESEKMAGLRA